jgi:hypothetical protein
MLTGTKINTSVVTTSRGLFLIYRGEKYGQYYTVIYSVQHLHVGFSGCKKFFTWEGGGLQCKV